jgi:hypothetical protein
MNAVGLAGTGADFNVMREASLDDISNALNASPTITYPHR